jgi:small subunit ribosomal protein S20
MTIFDKNIMANTKSAIKRIKKDRLKKLKNRNEYKSAKIMIKKIKLQNTKIDKSTIISKIDKLVKKNIIHKNKGAKLKSRLDLIKT